MLLKIDNEEVRSVRNFLLFFFCQSHLKKLDVSKRLGSFLCLCCQSKRTCTLKNLIKALQRSGLAFRFELSFTQGGPEMELSMQSLIENNNNKMLSKNVNYKHSRIPRIQKALVAM